MGINLKIFITTVFILFTAVYWSCKKKLLGCTESSYSFQLDVQVTPNNDTVTIGDTIWIEINSPEVFTDLRGGQPIDFSHANNLGTDMGFLKLINESPVQVDGAIADFKFILREGKETPSPEPTTIKEYLIADVNNRYVFELGIVPQATGTYSFNLANSVHVYRNSNPCPKADFNMRMVQTDQHYYLSPGGSSVTPAGADYYFYVK